MIKKIENTTRPKDLHTVSLLVANKPGVLVRIAQVFARRGYNIDSLVVSPSVDPRFSRMTITAQGQVETLDQIIKQANKLVDVIHASEHKPEETITLEMALVKVRLKPAQKTTIQNLIKKYRAHVVESTNKSIILEQTGTTDELNALEDLLKKFGIVEMVRSGKLVMARGTGPT